MTSSLLCTLSLPPRPHPCSPPNKSLLRASTLADTLSGAGRVIGEVDRMLGWNWLPWVLCHTKHTLRGTAEHISDISTDPKAP